MRLPCPPKTQLDLTLPLAQTITLTRGPGSHLVTLMDAAILIRDLEPSLQLAGMVPHLTIRRKRPGSRCREPCISHNVLRANPGGINIQATNADQGSARARTRSLGRFGFLVFGVLAAAEIKKLSETYATSPRGLGHCQPDGVTGQDDPAGLS